MNPQMIKDAKSASDEMHGYNSETNAAKIQAFGLILAAQIIANAIREKNETERTK